MLMLLQSAFFFYYCDCDCLYMLFKKHWYYFLLLLKSDVSFCLTLKNSLFRGILMTKHYNLKLLLRLNSFIIFLRISKRCVWVFLYKFISSIFHDCIQTTFDIAFPFCPKLFIGNNTCYYHVLNLVLQIKTCEVHLSLNKCYFIV